MQDDSKYRKAIRAVLAMAFVLGTNLGTNHAALAKDEGEAHLKPQARHIILFIGDGMQLEHEVAASRYLYGSDTKLSFHNLPYKNSVTTWDVAVYNTYARLFGQPPYNRFRVIPTVGYDPLKGGFEPYPFQSNSDSVYFLDPDGNSMTKAPATDSASAATAWATGHKTDDGNIAWLPGDPANGRLTTIAELLRKEMGYAIGVVSTVPFTHATPAAHVSHNKSRNNYHAIAREILKEFKPEVVIGGGHPLFDKKCTSPADPVACKPTYMPLGLYSEIKANPGDYAFVERAAGQDGAVALLEKAQAAAANGRKLFGLFGGPNGNFESPVPSDVPGNPLVTRPTNENPLLKDATLAALMVLSQDPDGFFLVAEQGDIDWANHANDYRRMIGTIWDLHTAVEAAIDFVDRESDNIHWGNTLLIVTSDHGNSFMRLNKDKYLGAGDLPTQVGFAYPKGQVTYGTRDHTNELARIYAKGKAIDAFFSYEGLWYPCHRIIDNTHLFHIMAEAAGVPQSPSLRIERTNPSGDPDTPLTPCDRMMTLFELTAEGD